MKLPLLVAIALLVSVKSAFGQLQLCNKTPVPVQAAAGHVVNDQWVANGWWRIWPGECSTVVAGSLNHRNYYLHAKSSGAGVTWGGDYTFCTASRVLNDLPRGSCAERGLDSTRFFEIDVGEARTHTRNLVCEDSCRLPKFTYFPDRRAIKVFHVHRQQVDGATVHIPIAGFVSLQESSPGIRLSINLSADLSHLQSKASAIVRAASARNEECGNRIETFNEVLTARGDSAELRVEGRYERWLCTYADLPQVRCEDTWIIAGPLKTKGIPLCTTWMDTQRTSKNMLLAQSGSGSVLLRPVVVGGTTIELRPEVDTFRLNGLAQEFVNLFRINLKALAQNKLEESIGGNTFAASLPSEIRQLFKLQEVSFSTDSAGRLTLTASGSVVVSPAQIASVCAQLLPHEACAGR